ncbi:MAG: DUF4097 family beta strand repeat-containing protein [Culicoidibacterales bacterium]
MRQKRVRRILGIILAITLPITIVCTIMVVTLSWQEGTFSGSNNPVEVTESTLKDVSEIKVSNLAGNVEFRPTDKAEVEIKSSGSEQILLNQTQTMLEITGKSKFYNPFSENRFRGLRGLVAFISENRGKAGNLLILVPESVKVVTLANNVGETKIANIKVDRLQIVEGSVGELKINDTTITELIEVNMGVGELKLDQISGNPVLLIRGGVGETTVANSSFQKVDIFGGLGSVEIDTIKTPEMYIEVGVGELTIKNSKIDSLGGTLGLGDIKLADNNIIKENKLAQNGSKRERKGRN